MREGDLVVVNDSRVFPARLLGNKPSGGRVDLLLLHPCDPEIRSSCWFDGVNRRSRDWECLIQSSRRPRKGQLLSFPHGLRGEVMDDSGQGFWRVRFNLEGKDLLAHLERHGLIPLPPYIRRNRPEAASAGNLEDRDRYQTVFARKVGSVAAPTAGFHFTDALCRSLEKRGISFAQVTLHVGQATFLPIRARDIRKHTMYPERYGVAEEDAEKMLKAKREGRRLVAVGTTVVRCLESLVAEAGRIEAGERWARLYILPGHRFEAVDALITNFHLPATTLLVLLCAFAQRDYVFRAYREAIRNEYRFFSYGDCMIVQ